MLRFGYFHLSHPFVEFAFGYFSSDTKPTTVLNVPGPTRVVGLLQAFLHTLHHPILSPV